MTTKIVIPNNEDLFYPGIDGQHFKIPLDKEFIQGDVIVPADFDSPLYIVEKPTHGIMWYDNHFVEYWLHTVMMFDHKPFGYHPKQYLFPQTIYIKLIA